MKLRVTQTLLTQLNELVVVCEILELGRLADEGLEAFVLRAGGLKFEVSKRLKTGDENITSLVLGRVDITPIVGMILHDNANPLSLEETLAQAHRFVYLVKLLNEFDADNMVEVFHSQKLFNSVDTTGIVQTLQALLRARLTLRTNRAEWRKFGLLVDEMNMRAGVVQSIVSQPNEDQPA